MDRTIYRFADASHARDFQTCLASDSLDACVAAHRPVSSREAAKAAPAGPEERGSTISPSLGGMP